MSKTAYIILIIVVVIFGLLYFFREQVNEVIVSRHNRRTEERILKMKSAISASEKLMSGQLRESESKLDAAESDYREALSLLNDNDPLDRPLVALAKDSLGKVILLQNENRTEGEKLMIEAIDLYVALNNKTGAAESAAYLIEKIRRINPSDPRITEIQGKIK
jgi:hypothetical protein